MSDTPGKKASGASGLVFRVPEKDKIIIEFAKPSRFSWFEVNYFLHKDIYQLRKKLFLQKNVENMGNRFEKMFQAYYIKLIDLIHP